MDSACLTLDFGAFEQLLIDNAKDSALSSWSPSREQTTPIAERVTSILQEKCRQFGLPSPIYSMGRVEYAILQSTQIFALKTHPSHAQYDCNDINPTEDDTKTIRSIQMEHQNGQAGKSSGNWARFRRSNAYRTVALGRKWQLYPCEDHSDGWWWVAGWWLLCTSAESIESVSENIHGMGYLARRVLPPLTTTTLDHWTENGRQLRSACNVWFR